MMLKPFFSIGRVETSTLNLFSFSLYPLSNLILLLLVLVKFPCLLDLQMEKDGKSMISKAMGHVSLVIRKCLFSILSMGPVPAHIAFIMDGNRRYAKRHALHQDNTDPNSCHRVDFKSLISNLQYYYEMGVKYVTVYAFSIDNFRRDLHEVQALMDLMKEKIDELMTEGGLLMKFDARINFWGNLELLPTRYGY